jgi:hypothetical protein
MQLATPRDRRSIDISMEFTVLYMMSVNFNIPSSECSDTSGLNFSDGMHAEEGV